MPDAGIALQQRRQCALRKWQASALYSGRDAGASIARSGPDGTRRRTGGEVKGKDANGVGSQ